jgi:hypothetical protein
MIIDVMNMGAVIDDIKVVRREAGGDHPLLGRSSGINQHLLTLTP